MQTPDEQGGGGLVAAAASASYGSVSNENESDVDVAGRSSSSSSGWRGAGGTEGPSVASLSLDRQASDASAKLSPRECAEEDDEENPGRIHLEEVHDIDADDDTKSIEFNVGNQKYQVEVRKMPKSKYDIKNHMANERTFFKYLFTGLHVGGIGTFVLSFFGETNGSVKIYLVISIWIAAFFFMFWGLYNYYRRKHLMETGHFKEMQMLNPHTPTIIAVLFTIIIGGVVLYSFFAKYVEEEFF